MSKIVVSVMNYDQSINKYEESSLPSRTTPDMAYTIKELFARYKAGMPIPGSRDIEYDDDSYQSDDNFDVDPLNRIGISDLTEIDEIRASVDELNKPKTDDK